MYRSLLNTHVYCIPMCIPMWFTGEKTGRSLSTTLTGLIWIWVSKWATRVYVDGFPGQKSNLHWALWQIDELWWTKMYIQEKPHYSLGFLLSRNQWHIKQNNCESYLTGACRGQVLWRKSRFFRSAIHFFLKAAVVSLLAHWIWSSKVQRRNGSRYTRTCEQFA